MSTPTVLFTSHDGFGLGHVRRNVRLAAALRRVVPDVAPVLVTGVAGPHPWLDDRGFRVERVPSLGKDHAGRYCHPTLPLTEALERRARRFAALVEELRPRLVVVDRHPFGVGGELRRGLALARTQGAAVLLGLRDIIDDPRAVRAEIEGDGWKGAAQVVDQLLVYGERRLCNHRREYHLPVKPHYVGVVVDPSDSRPDHGAVVVTAGGGGDGREVARLAAALAGRRSVGRTILVKGPAATWLPGDEQSSALEVHSQVDDCAVLYAGARASVQMAGYNSTYEALAAGLRPILVPRRAPRREQAIRATRLSHLGLADVVDLGATPDEVAWLLGRPRRLGPGDVLRAGLRLDGADRAARRMADLAGLATTSERGVA